MAQGLHPGPARPRSASPAPVAQPCVRRSPWRLWGAECWPGPRSRALPWGGSAPALKLGLAWPRCPGALGPLAGQRGLQGQPRVSFWRRCDSFRTGSGSAQCQAPGPRRDWRRARPCSTQGSAGHRLDRGGACLGFLLGSVSPAPRTVLVGPEASSPSPGGLSATGVSTSSHRLPSPPCPVCSGMFGISQVTFVQRGAPPIWPEFERQQLIY